MMSARSRSFRPHSFVTIALLLIGAAPVFAQSTEDSFRVYTDQPRLFLRAERLRRLKRERERDSMRWEQFNSLISGNAQMPEPGLADALHYAVAGDAKSGKSAIEFAAASGDIRQVALVFDWCHPLLTPAEAKILESKLARAIAQPASAADLQQVRARTLAAIAIADEDRDASEKMLRWVVRDWWRGNTARVLNRNAKILDGPETYALYEILHAVRDNLMIDLREDARSYFSDLPGKQLLSYYPPAYPARENDYRIPAFKGAHEPDLSVATMSRMAELSMIAYDVNTVDSQYLQGWISQDRFLARGALGSPYEFLWANPYEPGLSFHHFHLSEYDPGSGRLFARSSWDDEADWFGIVDGETQYFHDGKLTVMNPKMKQAPICIGQSMIVMAPVPLRFDVPKAELSQAFVLGLAPRSKYDIEINYEGMYEGESDREGTLRIDLPSDTAVNVRIKPARTIPTSD